MSSSEVTAIDMQQMMSENNDLNAAVATNPGYGTYFNSGHSNLMIRPRANTGKR